MANQTSGPAFLLFTYLLVLPSLSFGQGAPSTLLVTSASANSIFRFNGSLCANMTETSCVTAISEQGGKEKTQNGNDERRRQTRNAGHGIHRFGIG